LFQTGLAFFNPVSGSQHEAIDPVQSSHGDCAFCRTKSSACLPASTARRLLPSPMGTPLAPLLPSTFALGFVRCGANARERGPGDKRADFRDFTFANLVRLFGRQNPRIFAGSSVAAAAEAVLREAAAPARAAAE